MDKTSIKTASAQTGVRASTAPPTLSVAVPPAGVKRPAPGPIATFLRPLASLRLTVALFAMCLVLVFAGTLAQIDHGIWTVVAKYFRAFFVWIPLQIFFPRSINVPGGFPFLGGYVLGGALLVNLLAAHAVRFKLTWKRSGIIVLHSGLILLMLGELITGLFSVEARMTIPEGTTRNFVEVTEKEEIAISKPSATDPAKEDVVVIPGSILRKGGLIKDEKLPFDVVVEKYMRNSEVTETPPPGTNNPATAGDGLKIVALERSEASGVETNQMIDIPAAYVTFKDKKSGEPLGTYLLSVEFYAFLDMPQHVTVAGTAYDVYLRFKRVYKPYSIQLNKFSHDRYDGTDIPKNYSSLVVLDDPSRNVKRDVLIWMNHPLYYDGDTFYQADFLKGQQRGTILQVVHNPGWTLPYLACGMVALGMLLHFGLTLINFVSKHAAPSLTNRPVNGRRPVSVAKVEPFNWNAVGVSAFVVGVACLYLLVVLMPPSTAPGAFDYNSAGKIQIVDGGRNKPLDSFAHTKLVIISGKQSVYDDNKEEHSAMEWLLDVMTSNITKNGKAESYKVFRIENDQVLNLLGLPQKPGSYRYSIDEIAGKEKIARLEEESERASNVDPKKRTLFDAKVLELAQHIQIYIELSRLQVPLMIDPATPGEKPESLGRTLVNMTQGGAENPQAEKLWGILNAYGKKDVAKFNSNVESYRTERAATQPYPAAKAEFETWFNHFAPFYQCMGLYVVVFLLAAVSWLVFRKPLNRAAFWLMVFTLLLHTVALVSRIYIQGRPPVTNLYSSAIFIGWVAVTILVIVECFFKYGIASFLAGIIGFATLFIAHFLSLDGDTMEMLQAVLDTNFWLATHVTAVTTGYAATFVAGCLGVLYIVASIYNNSARTLERSLFSDVAGSMLYGVVCFAMFFSFTGTVLGGLWADYSWGRFWGWDPKENGALLIVIWNALILHARWSGMVKARGMAVLAVFGNIVTSWSWFGVNMLGVGLHSYGFMQGALFVLILWCLANVAIMVAGMIPALHAWQRLPDKESFKVASV